MTRGRDQVVMIYENTPSPFLTQMNANLLWQDNDYAYEGTRAQNALPHPAVNRGRRMLPPSPIEPHSKVVVTKPWPECLSPSAQFYLRKYFAAAVYRHPNRPLPYKDAGKHLDGSFKQWLKPENINGVKVSKLFYREAIRADVLREIQSELARYGCGLVLDRQ